MNKLVVAFAAWTLVCGTIAAGHAAEKRAGNEPGKEPSATAVDKRPHIPRMLEVMGPTLDSLVDSLGKDHSPDAVARVSQTLKEVADEIREMYRLSMAASDVQQQAEDLYRRVKETERVASKMGKKQR